MEASAFEGGDNMTAFREQSMATGGHDFLQQYLSYSTDINCLVGVTALSIKRVAMTRFMS